MVGGTNESKALGALRSGLRWVWAAWKRFAHLIGRINTFILLTLCYVFVFGPTAILQRLFGSRLLDRSWRAATPTYWVEREHRLVSLEDLKRQF